MDASECTICVCRFIFTFSHPIWKNIYILHRFSIYAEKYYNIQVTRTHAHRHFCIAYERWHQLNPYILTLRCNSHSVYFSYSLFFHSLTFFSQYWIAFVSQWHYILCWIFLLLLFNSWAGFWCCFFFHSAVNIIFEISSIVGLLIIFYCAAAVVILVVFVYYSHFVNQPKCKRRVFQWHVQCMQCVHTVYTINIITTCYDDEEKKTSLEKQNDNKLAKKNFNHRHLYVYDRKIVMQNVAFCLCDCMVQVNAGTNKYTLTMNTKTHLFPLHICCFAWVFSKTVCWLIKQTNKLQIVCWKIKTKLKMKWLATGFGSHLNAKRAMHTEARDSSGLFFFLFLKCHHNHLSL